MEPCSHASSELLVSHTHHCGLGWVCLRTCWVISRSQSADPPEPRGIAQAPRCALRSMVTATRTPALQTSCFEQTTLWH